MQCWECNMTGAWSDIVEDVSPRGRHWTHSWALKLQSSQILYFILREFGCFCAEYRRGRGAQGGVGRLATSAMASVDCSEMTSIHFRFEIFLSGKRKRIWMNANLDTYGHMMVSWWRNKGYLMYCRRREDNYKTKKVRDKVVFIKHKAFWISIMIVIFQYLVIRNKHFQTNFFSISKT